MRGRGVGRRVASRALHFWKTSKGAAAGLTPPGGLTRPRLSFSSKAPPPPPSDQHQHRVAGMHRTPVVEALWQARNAAAEAAVNPVKEEEEEASWLLTKTPSDSTLEVRYDFRNDVTLREVSE